MKRLYTYAAVAVLALLTACSDNEENKNSVPTISGEIVEVNSFGQPIPSFTPAEMKAMGFDYADLVDVTIGDIHLRNMPFVSSFNEVAVLEPSYVDYNAKGDDYGFAMLNGDFHYYICGKPGDKVTMTLAQKGGYQKTYELMKSVYATDRQAGETATEYANFRMVTTTGIAPGVLYRSSNPLNCVKNAKRYAVADSLARVVGIKTEIDLADTPEEVAKYMAMDGYASSYCPALFNAGNTIACGMMANSFNDDFKTRMGEAAKFMLTHEPPYLLHCNEGKDRCGFVSMLLEALAGAGVEELRRDYMVTLLNFYKIEDMGESYQMRQSLSIDRMIWLLCNEESLENYVDINWDDTDVTAIDWDELGLFGSPTGGFQGVQLQAAAKKYLKECGLSDDECEALRLRLTTGD